MRGYFALTAAISAALVTAVPSAAASAPEPAACTATAADAWCFFPAPADWERASGDFWSCPSCQAYGDQGIQHGRWSDYHCEGRVQGLDYYYDLYVPPQG